MALVEMLMPKMGESVMEGTILNWLKKVGDSIEQDEPVLEVATDKVDTEIPATHSGILQEILAKEGEVVQVGKPIAIISTEGVTLADNPLNQEDTQEVFAAIEQSLNQAKEFIQNPIQPQDTQTDRFYSPLVLNIAKQENISMLELSAIPGTGMDSRVTKHDILNYVQQKKNQEVQIKPAILTPQVTGETKLETPKTPAFTPTASTIPSTPAVSLNGNMDIIEMDRMRKMIAQRMVESVHISPHVTTFVEVDVTNIVLWRNKIKEAFKKKEGENITYTPIFIQATARALKDFPMVNISVEGDKILVKKDIHIGMAAALPNGNLIVPVIHHADHLSLVGLTKKVNDLANRARLNKLSADELSGGTYTISNIGSFGNEMGTPIIVQPQVAIMAFGSIKKKPAVIETPSGDMIAIRHMMFISHSYDHRVIDGALGGSFARRVADYLEAFDLQTEI
ncbi:MAG: dihydrolipoamide acetyltransferase family protein [Microscillaceae bacterium]|nr:dihydrolipoamide acetyltransferase family protein [Microscillaceae bacterium]